MRPHIPTHRLTPFGVPGEPPSGFDVELMRQIASELAAGPIEALGIAKRLINQAAGVDRLDHHLDQELAQLAAIADGASFAEGITAFFEKRLPRFPLPATRGEGGSRPGEGP